jgi:hypothetical protein
VSAAVDACCLPFLFISHIYITCCAGKLQTVECSDTWTGDIRTPCL